jgi:branched-chain amino acid transport system permease protein
VLLAVTATVLLLTYLVVRAAASSPWGRVLRAIRDSEATAAAAGKDTVNFRMQSFVLGGMIMGLAGAVWAHRQGTISPDSFDDLLGTFLVWTMLMVGGSGRHLGAMLGALVVGFFWFGTPLLQGQLPEAVSSHVFALRQLAIGFMIVAVLLIRPQGILPEQPRVSRFAPRGPRD